MESYQLMILIGFVVLVLVISLVMYLVYGGSKDTSGEDSEDSEVPLVPQNKEGDLPEEPQEKIIDPNGNVIRGFTTSGLVAEGGGIIKGDSMAECREKAKNYGYVGTGYRSPKHADSKLRNTCFFYNKAESKWSGEKHDIVHVSGCTDAGKVWPDCGVNNSVVPGWTPHNLITTGPEEAENIQECRKRAKELDYIGVGFRTTENESMEYKDTCFYYDGINSNFKGNFGDVGAVTGCTDATKSWPDC